MENKEAFIYGKIQTNRATIKKYLEKFKTIKRVNESMTAPRPLPQRLQTKYYAVIKFVPASSSYNYFNARKGFEFLEQSDYEKELDSIKYCWRE